MRKMSLSKVKRELLRLGRQTRAAPRVAWEYCTLTIRYDIMAARQRNVHTGDRALAGEVAVYLIFPSKGILASHLDMLRQLNAHDISPILVSNLPLSQKDLAILKPLCTRIIERPNIGYDFGGYRDGILNLAGDLPKFDRLYLLNDSCWMIDASSSWFEMVRDANTDFCAASAHEGLRNPDPHDYRNFVWTYKTDGPRFHYASYALSVSNRILRDPEFSRFWRKFRLSDSKSVNIRRGEVGLTQWMLRRNCYSHTATCPLDNLDQEISGLDNDELDAVARNLVISSIRNLRITRDKILKIPACSREGRFDRIQIILTAVRSEGLSYVMPFYTSRYRGFQFVKKSPIWLSRGGSDTMIALLDSLPGPMVRHAAHEARTLRPGAWPMPATDAKTSSEKDGQEHASSD